MRKDHKARQMTRMPFGKFKGIYFKDVPDDYLDWAARHWVESQYRPILTLVIEEIEHRHFNRKKSERGVRKDNLRKAPSKRTL